MYTYIFLKLSNSGFFPKTINHISLTNERIDITHVKVICIVVKYFSKQIKIKQK